MSFNIVFSTNSSPVNRIDKELTTVITAIGTLRDGASILNPEVEIESLLSESVVKAINYAYIGVFGRYYFVTDIRTEVNGLWVVTMHVDVLMTYKESIYQQNAVVARQEANYNMYLDDGWFMAYQNPYIQTKFFSNTEPFETQEFVLVIAGSGAGSSPGVVPGPVTGFTATLAGTNNISLFWNRVDGKATYRIARSKNGGAYALVTENLNANMYVDTNLTSGTYTYVIRAVNSQGQGPLTTSNAVTV